VAKNTENAALLVQRIILEMFIFWKASHGLPLPPLPVASRSLSSARRSPTP
jgi:hypothetical protein